MKNKLFIFVILMLLSIFLFSVLCYADSQTIFICGGDNETIFYCFGDNESVYSEYIAPSILIPIGGLPGVYIFNVTNISAVGDIVDIFHKLAEKEIIIKYNGIIFKIKYIYLIIIVLCVLMLICFLIYFIKRRKIILSIK